MKNFTIILIGCMTLVLKVLAMFTLSMGTLILKSTILIYGWLPAHIEMVMGVAIFLINIGKINKKYFDSIKSVYIDGSRAVGHVSLSYSTNLSK